MGAPGFNRNRRLAAAATLLALAATAPAPQARSRPAQRAEHGVVVSVESLASEVGRDVLAAGGNAVDAAVAVAFALAVTYPQAGNLGGGGFLLYRTPGGEHHALDFREAAPAALRPELFLDEDGRPVPGRSLDTGLAVGVPGSVAGLWEAHRRWGSRPWAGLLAPAVRLAAEGFPISRREADDLSTSGKRILADPEARRIFTRDGVWPRAGERLVQPDLAATLRRIADRGPEGFYRGPVARAIVDAVNGAGGVMTRRDLARYRAVWREPVRGSYRGYTVVSFPPPSSGGVALLQMLKLLERHDLAASGAGSSLTLHRVAEVERRVYADRSRWLGDPDFWNVPVAGLLDPEYLAQRAATIRDDRATPSTEIAPGEPPRHESADTTHFSVADARGGAVALTTTLNAAYGVGIVAPGTGVLLNNEIDDFAVAPGVPNAYGLVGGEANSIAGAKRPLSSMTPAIVEAPGGGDRPFLVLGSPGGPRIITAVLQVVLNVIDHGMPLQEAVDAPRFHHQWLPDRLFHESRGLVEDVRRGLEARGHRVVERDGDVGNVNAIGLAPDGAWLGAADPRREGAVAGH